MESTVESIPRAGSTSAAWYQAGRAPFFVATLIPLGLGGVAAYAEGGWNAARWIVILIASFFVHFCTNIANDYFDYTSGADAGDSIGGSRVLHEGKITLRQLRNAMIVLYGLSFLCGLWIVVDSGVWWLSGIMALAFFSSLFYTAPPIRYGYRGLGEIFVALNMGVVMVAGTATALAGRFVPSALWLSIPVGLMVAMILYYQSLPDIDADRAVGKRTIAVRLGKPKAVWGYRFFVLSALGSIVALVLTDVVHPVALISLVTVILAYRIDRMIVTTEDWKDLHDRGGRVRMFYLFNGLVLILTTALIR